MNGREKIGFRFLLVFSHLFTSLVEKYDKRMKYSMICIGGIVVFSLRGIRIQNFEEPGNIFSGGAFFYAELVRALGDDMHPFE